MLNEWFLLIAIGDYVLTLLNNNPLYTWPKRNQELQPKACLWAKQWKENNRGRKTWKRGKGCERGGPTRNPSAFEFLNWIIAIYIILPFHFSLVANKPPFHKLPVFKAAAYWRHKQQRSLAQSTNRFVLISVEMHRPSHHMIQTRS